MIDEIFEKLRSIPEFSKKKSLVITPFSEGMNNRNYKIQYGEESFALRIFSDLSFIGVNRYNEYMCALIASKLNVGPEIIQFIPENNLLVCRYIEGKKATCQEMAKVDNIKRFVNTLTQLHHACDFPSTFSIFKVIEAWWKIAVKEKAPIPHHFEDVFSQIAEMEQIIKHYSADLVPCHNDLYFNNIIDTGTNFLLIDYEFAAMGDPFFDLANFSIHHLFNDDQDKILLEYYFKSIDQKILNHFTIMKMLSNLRECLWGLLQYNKELNVDYITYIYNHYNRYRKAYLSWNHSLLKAIT